MAIFSILPLLILVFVFVALRSQLNRPNTEERRREIMQNLSQQYGAQPNAQPPTRTPPPRPGPAYRQQNPHTPQDPAQSRYIAVERPPVQRDYTTDFRNAYYQSLERGRDFDPWDLPPEKGPWGY